MGDSVKPWVAHLVGKSQPPWACHWWTPREFAEVPQGPHGRGPEIHPGLGFGVAQQGNPRPVDLDDPRVLKRILPQLAVREAVRDEAS